MLTAWSSFDVFLVVGICGQYTVVTRHHISISRKNRELSQVVGFVIVGHAIVKLLITSSFREFLENFPKTF